MNRRAKPAAVAAAMEERRHYPESGGERFSGYGVTELRFDSGDVLAFRRVTASSIGPPFASLWHRDSQGRWVIYTNVDPSRSCHRYVDPGFVGVRTDDVEVRWTGGSELAVTVRHARLHLGLRLAATAGSVALSALWRVLPLGLWQRPVAASVLGDHAAGLLDAERVLLSGCTPAGHRYVIRPRQVWLVEAAAAVLDGRDLGTLLPGGAPDDGRKPARRSLFLVADGLVGQIGAAAGG